MVYIQFLLMLMGSLYAAEKIPSGKIDSPYEACKNVLLVSEGKFIENRESWDSYAKNCNKNILAVTDAGFTSLNPLKEGVDYLLLAQKVANKIISNLDKSQSYADCTASCFAGAQSCSQYKSGENTLVKCDDRKKEVKASLNVNARKIRSELALSSDAPGIVNVNVQNVLSVGPEKRINTNTRDFELGLPNPIGRQNLSEREIKHALTRLDFERKKLEKEFAEKKYNNYNDWMSVKLMENMEKHREQYRSLIYEEAPIFSVIDRPEKFDGSDPVWDDKQIEKAFIKLSNSAKNTKMMVNESLKNGKLEFSRLNGEALGKYLSSLTPGKNDNNDLLFYMGMKNQVNDVLKENPNYCPIATTMHSRLQSKNLQNSAVLFAGSVAASVATQGVGNVATNIFRIGRALTSLEASGISGLALGAVTLGDSFRQYNSYRDEAATRSGLDPSLEGTALREASDIAIAREGLKMSILFSPMDVWSAWKAGQSLYSSFGKQMLKEFPEATKGAKALSLQQQDQLVEKWLSKKINALFGSGVLRLDEVSTFSKKESRQMISDLLSEIEKKNPDFLKNESNVDFLLKTAASALKKTKGDPSDFPEKARALLLNFNTEAIAGQIDPEAQKGLLKVFNSALDELRLSAKNDPATYTKFMSDRKSQEAVMKRALKRSGASDDVISAMTQCSLQ